MAFHAINSQLGRGGAKVADDLKSLFTELQGLKVNVVAGATAGTKMDIAAMRDEDTIVGAVNLTDNTELTLANITIQSVKASGTVTYSVAAPSNGETVTVNGVVYTHKTTPGAPYTDVALGASITAAATNLKNAINAYEGARFGGRQVVATSNAGVVTVTAVVEGTAGNAITLAETGTNIAVSGATLAGGTATGGFKSTDNLSAKQVMVVWFNKR
jgi:hypothetical protein